MFASFRAASPKAKAMNIAFWLFNFMAWIACCVAFGSELIKTEEEWTTQDGKPTGDRSDFHWYHDKVTYYQPLQQKTVITMYDDSDDCSSADCSACLKGGRGLMGTIVLAFMPLCGLLALTLMHIGGMHLKASASRVVFFEAILTAIVTFFFFLAVCIFGGTCYAEIGRTRNQDYRHGTGFAYIIFCFLLLVINTAIGFLMSRDATTHIGDDAPTGYMPSDDSNTTNYNAAATYQYHADPAPQAYATATYPAGESHDNNL